jgi:hypothetical protein
MKPLKNKKSIFVIMLLMIPMLFFATNLEAYNTQINPDNTQINPDKTIIINTEPVVVSDTIVLDTSGDGIGPCEDDRPHVTAEFEDDGNITDAYVWYADHDKDNWGWFQLYESETDNKIWNGSFPYIKHGRTIRWFTGCEDDEGLGTDEWPSVEFFTVLNRAPIVELTFPVGGENFTSHNQINVTWNGHDLDLLDIVTYEVLYNKDAGGWTLIEDEITDTFYVWDISGKAYSDSVRIKVIADDGYDTTEDISEPFTMGEHTTPSPDPTVGFEYLILLISLVSFTSIPIYLRKRRRK